MKWITAILLYLLYWGICVLSTGTDRKNLIGLRSYPDEVQERVWREMAGNVPREKPMAAVLLSNLILFTLVFSLLGLALKKPLVVIDLLWWRSSKRIRFSFLPEKNCYRNPGKHMGSFLRGIPLFAVVAALSAGIVTLL